MADKPKAKPGTDTAPAQEAKEPNIRWVGMREANPHKAPEAKEGQEPENVPEDNFVHIPNEKEGEEKQDIARPFEEPVTSFAVGNKTYTLPSAAEQKAGWYSEDARIIIEHCPGYKWVENLGGKK